MGKRYRFSIVLVLIILFSVIGTSLPASARGCAGQGIMHLQQKIGLPVFGQKTDVGFSLTLKCTVGGGTATATGVFTSATCVTWKGKGTISGKSFRIHSVGSVLYFTGDKVTGVVNTVADARKGDNCLQTTADDFLVTALFKGI